MGHPPNKARGLAHLTLVLALGAASLSTPADARRPAPVKSPLLAPPAVSTHCVDDDLPANPAPSAPAQTHAATAGGGVPRLDLLTLVQTAIRRSRAVGAAKLLKDAADLDVQEARAGALPQASLSGQAGGLESGAPAVGSLRGLQSQVAVSVTAPLWDAGRVKDMTGYRSHMSEAARFGEISSEEQIALQTVSLALDRSRYTVESQVYEQYAHKMSCLVDALQQIVAMDRGRASELVLAHKSQAQAELARQQSLAQRRSTEVQLRRFVGEDLPPAAGLSSVMLDIPNLDELLAVATRTPEVEQLDAQAQAMDDYVKSILDGDRPQLGWLLQASRIVGSGAARDVVAGVSLSVPLFNPSIKYTTEAARKRAEAAHLQHDDALEARVFRIRQVHQEAEHSMDRAHQIVGILHDSELLRNFTLQQWQQLGRRSLFDVMSAEGDHYSMRVQYVDALFDTQQNNALLWSLGLGLADHLH